VLRASSVESRFEALHPTGLTALVGRDEETELLLGHWSRAKAGEGQVVLLSGEAGIGKSRMTAVLLERLASEPHTRLRYFCSPQHGDSTLYPIIRQLERAMGLRADDTPQSKLDKLDALLSESAASREDAALLAEMLSLANDGRYPLLELAPQQRRQRTLEALLAQSQALARHNPVLLVFEDAHWADPTSLEVITALIDKIQTLRVLLIVTFRPEFVPLWVGRSQVWSLTINRLTQREVITLIDRVAGNKVLPAQIREDIIERADGIPLFVEEMTKAVLEAKGEGAAARTLTAIPSPALAVPATLHASLMARLDRLGGAKEVAQIGAAIGREFPHALLAAVVRQPEADLESALNQLIDAGLLFRQGAAPHATYLFKHALVQDAAYGTLLREPRRALHSRIAETLEKQFADIAANQPELLAHHCTEAGQIEKAAGLWGKAGQRSLQRSALVESIEQFTRALAQIRSLPSTSDLRRLEIKLQFALITPLIYVKGFAVPETVSAAARTRSLIEQAEALGEPPENPLLMFAILNVFWNASYAAFNASEMFGFAVQILARGEKQEATIPRMMGHRLMGLSLLFTGEIVQGREHLDRAFALYDPAERRPLASRLGRDFWASTLSERSVALWTLGYPDAAVADSERMLQSARNFGRAATLMYALCNGSMPYIFCGDYAAAYALYGELVALTEEKGAPALKGFGMMNRGCLLALTGRASDAVEMIVSGIAAWRSTGARFWEASALSYLARAYAELDQFDDAWRCIGQALKGVETTKERWYEAEINRMAGEIALFSPGLDATKAQGHFERALAVSRAQQAKSWELRAAMSLASLWRDQGKVQQARELLAPVYDWFTEGFHTRDLKEAQALLQQLAA
jgi:predicted ATPase